MTNERELFAALPRIDDVVNRAWWTPRTPRVF